MSKERAIQKAMERYDRVTAKAVLDKAFGEPEAQPANDSIDDLLRRLK